MPKKRLSSAQLRAQFLYDNSYSVEVVLKDNNPALLRYCVMEYDGSPGMRCNRELCYGRTFDEAVDKCIKSHQRIQESKKALNKFYQYLMG